MITLEQRIRYELLQFFTIRELSLMSNDELKSNIELLK